MKGKRHLSLSALLLVSSITAAPISGIAQTNSATEQNVQQTLTNTEGTTVTTATSAFQSTQAAFTAETKYFQANADITVYDNSTGSLVPMGTLKAGETYERISAYGNWHKISFGKKFGFVLAASTVPSSSKAESNWDASTQSISSFKASQDLEIYDNSGGTLTPFAEILKGAEYPIIGKAGNWVKVHTAGRIGYIHSSKISEEAANPVEQTQTQGLFFKPTIGNLGVYDNANGKLVKVGELDQTQSYPYSSVSGNWLKVHFGAKTMFVFKGNVSFTNGKDVKNKVTQSNSGPLVKTTKKTVVYDNTSGKLVPFGAINSSQEVKLIGKMGTWYKVNFIGRTGYFHESMLNTSTPAPAPTPEKPAEPQPTTDFKLTDRYFEVTAEELPIMQNNFGTLKKVGVLQKGQTYERIRDYGNWHEIQYNRGTAFVLKKSTKPTSTYEYTNSAQSTPSDVDLLTVNDATVYDNSNQTLKPFAVIHKGEHYLVLGEAGSWYKVMIANRIGYINKADAVVGPVIKTTNYPITFNEFLNTQMTRVPQTDLYRNEKAYVHSAYVDFTGTTFPVTGTVNTDNLNVREGAGVDYWQFGKLKTGDKIQVLGKEGSWLEIRFGAWRNAKSADTARFANPANFTKDSKEYFQFLVLSQSAGISLSDLNDKILVNKGILSQQGKAFLEAGTTHNINEIYLISHSLLETGNGSSKLSNGILVSTVQGKPVEPKIVYNMYGIGAYDHCAESCGAERAYTEGWFTPEAAIIGGAEYIGEGYINNETYKQDTLYKMRWNPERPGTHQYATDIGWSVKQVNNIKKLYDMVDRYTLYHDVPTFK
ncbi:mannosyl-glycoprotein endo-beta-N-acetylglucosaminidase [Bacillus ectoiniformans]|uniref:SH3 domain-containing protein n=1 Tax=Bacillus ectoiniformans TaxID=1494429 RepID=UPI00195D02BD|nr:SH3 domain-containing protein [Bacillus ectoiniformans]MBM7649323.1 mannosyl-glycoprotein endo-beta-N-acetylglucosaminidase [Bacillus ectoiniformans]